MEISSEKLCEEKVFRDGYRWNSKLSETGEKYPLIFHGTRDFLLESILEKGLKKDSLNMPNDILSYAAREAGGVIDNIGMGAETGLSFSLSYNIAKKHSIKGPEQLDRFFRYTKIPRLMHLKYIPEIREVKNKFENSDPIVFYVRTDLSKFDNKWNDLDYFLDEKKRESILQKLKKIKKEDLTYFPYFVERFGLEDAIQLHYRTSNYAIHTDFVSPVNIIGYENLRTGKFKQLRKS